MGLDVSHDCWHGAYSAFMRWRCALAIVAGLPPLELMEGFYNRDSNFNVNDPFWMIKHDIKELDKKNAQRRGLVFDNKEILSLCALLRIEKSFPIPWKCLEQRPLLILLRHSDCDGEISWEDCQEIADDLESLLPDMPWGEDWGHIGCWKDKTKQFIEGLRKAFDAKEDLEFG